MNPTIVTAATTALATTIATQSLNSPLETFNDLWDGIVGHHVAAWSEKRKIQAFKNVENFKQDLADEVNKIPIENIQEPQTSIVGPTLEASKYYMDEENLRIMFAKIIASSMDSRKNSYVQHSFVEIIKQLTPLDAQIFRTMENFEPIVNIFMRDVDSTSSQIVYYDLFIHPNFPNTNLNSISVNNLSRLGLINIRYDASFTDKDVYIPFKSTKEYLHVEQMCENDARNGVQKAPSLAKGISTITNFGKTFRDICVY